MSAATKLAVSIGELSPISTDKNHPERLQKCALRSALRALMLTTGADGKAQAAATPEAKAMTDLYALMKNCAFFNGGHCDCSSTSRESTLTVLYRSRHQL
jgi:hypothetical protein